MTHPNFPGQYKHLAHQLASDPENQVVFISNPKPQYIPGVQKVEVQVPTHEGGGGSRAHRYLQDFEKAIYRGQAVWRVCADLKVKGFVPDVICSHPGWGDGLFLKDIFPDVPLLNYCEFYYRSFGADVHFHPEQKINPDTLARVRIKNSNNILNLEACDWGITPTHWQRQLHPSEFKHKISVLHEGIDTLALKPGKPTEPLILSDGQKLKPEDEIITYVARNLEPYRGFPIFMQAVATLLKERPACRVLIIGNDGSSYSDPPQGKTYKQLVLEKTKFDKDRVYFFGWLPYEQMVQVLRYSSVHVYWTVPFVLSWSMLEAMALGCLVLGSDTSPVREIIQDGRNGLLADFFSPLKIVEKIIKVLDHPDLMAEVRKRARETVEENYALKDTLPLHLALIRDLAERRVPPPTAEAIQRYSGRH